MLLSFVGLIVGLILIIYGADRLVEGGASLAARFNIPNIVIGLTIVAFGTSAPELIVSCVSAVKGQSALALGNVVGSNIFNILAILGLTSVIYPIAVRKTTTFIEVPLTILAAVSILVAFFLGKESGVIQAWEGWILLTMFVLFTLYTVYIAIREDSNDVEVKHISLWKSLLFIAIGFAGLLIGGRWLVDSAVVIATGMGISERIIAVTIVSMGTSLPELATSIVAARKHKADMAIGNVVGSNIFNIFLILGISSVISPIEIARESLMDVYLNILASLLLFLFIFTGKGRQIERWEGMLFLSCYGIYLAILLLGIRIF